MSNFANDGGVQHWVRVLRNDGVRGVCVDRRFGACVLAGGRDEGRVGPGGGGWVTSAYVWPPANKEPMVSARVEKYVV